MARTRGSGSIYRQKTSAFWWIKYHRDGKIFGEAARSTDQREASSLLKKRLAEITPGTFLGSEIDRIRVGELADDFLRDWSPTSLGILLGILIRLVIETRITPECRES
jgi:hypothetical protein